MAQVVMDRGPVADQLNIAAAGVAVNNVSLTVTGQAGPVLLIAQVAFSGGALSELCEIRIRRNAAALAHSRAAADVYVAADVLNLTAFAVVPDAAVGDVFDVMALAAATTADILINDAQLIMVGLPHMSSVAPQATATA